MYHHTAAQVAATGLTPQELMSLAVIALAMGGAVNFGPIGIFGPEAPPTVQKAPVLGATCNLWAARHRRWAATG